MSLVFLGSRIVCAIISYGIIAPQLSNITSMNSFLAGVVIDILKELLINITTRFVTQANASFLKGSPTAQFVLVIILGGFWQMLTNEILWDFPINMVTEFSIQIFTRVFMGKSLLKKFWCAWSLSEYLF